MYTTEIVIAQNNIEIEKKNQNKKKNCMQRRKMKFEFIYFYQQYSQHVRKKMFHPHIIL